MYNASAGLPGRSAWPQGQVYGKERRGLEKSEADVPAERGSHCLASLIAVLLEHEADVVTSSAAKEARKQNFSLHFPLYEY